MMTDHAVQRGRDLLARRHPVEEVSAAYLQRAEGNPSLALRLAAADVLALDHRAAMLGAGASWGFVRTSRSALLNPRG